MKRFINLSLATILSLSMAYTTVLASEGTSDSKSLTNVNAVETVDNELKNLIKRVMNTHMIDEIKVYEETIDYSYENKLSKAYKVISMEKGANNSIIALHDNSIIYFNYGEEENYDGEPTFGGTSNITYYKYDFELNETINLGTVNNYYYMSNVVLSNNRLYFNLFTSGEHPNGNNNFYAIDLDNNELIELYKEDRVLSLLEISLIDDKMLTLKSTYDTEKDEHITYLDIYNPSDNTTYNILEKKAKYGRSTDGEIILTFDYYDDKIYVVVEKRESMEKVEGMKITQQLNVYDITGKLINSMNLADFQEEFLHATEIKIMGDFIFIRNRSIPAFVGKMEDDKIIPVINSTDDLANDMHIAKYHSNNNSDKYVFFQIFTHNIILLDIKTGELQNINLIQDINLELDEEYERIRNITVDEENKLLIELYSDDMNQRFYYFDINDLWIENN